MESKAWKELLRIGKEYYKSKEKVLDKQLWESVKKRRGEAMTDKERIEELKQDNQELKTVIEGYIKVNRGLVKDLGEALRKIREYEKQLKGKEWVKDRNEWNIVKEDQNKRLVELLENDVRELKETVQQIIHKMQWRDEWMWKELDKRMTWSDFVVRVLGVVVGVTVAILLFKIFV